MICRDYVAETNEFRSGMGAHWPFLSDPRRTVQKDLDITEYTNPGHNRWAAPPLGKTLTDRPGCAAARKRLRQSGRSALSRRFGLT